MNKFNKKLLPLLLIIIMCTSCRSISIDKSNTATSGNSDSFLSEDTDLNSDEAIAEQTRFDTYTDDLFTRIVSESSLSVHSYFSYPENYGLENCPYTLGDATEKTFDEDNDKLQTYLDELNEFSYEYLTSEQKLTYDILKTDLQDSLDFSEYYLFDDYLSPMSGIVSSIPSFFGEFELNDKADVKDYLELIKLIPEYYDSVMDFENTKTEKGMGIPDFQIDSLIDSCNEFINDVDNHFLITTFDSRIASLTDISDSEKSSYIKDNSDIVKNSIIPAYQKLISKLSALKGKSASEGGLCKYEGGKDYYEILVRSYTASDKSVSDIKKIINDRLQQDVNSVVLLSYKDSDLYDKMDEYPFDTSDPDKILQHLLDSIKKDFPDGYDTNYTVNDVPLAIEKYENPAYYYIPHIDNTSKNNIYINRNDTDRKSTRLNSSH